MIYLDNAATTFPKPPCVLEAVSKCISEYCANSGRSAHSLAVKTAEEIYSVRERVASLLNFSSPENVCFTSNATYALNMAMKCLIPHGTHVILSDLEHNSTLRPIERMKSTCGISYSHFSTHGDIAKNIEAVLENNTSTIVSTLMSNVSGDELSLQRLSETAEAHNLRLIVDASQMIGHKRIDMGKYACDALCAPGHKGLFGIQGAGILCFGKDPDIKSTLIEGGSGNHSESILMPDKLPEMMEAGTLPSPSVISLGAGIDFINDVGLDSIEEHINGLTDYLSCLLSELKNIEVVSAKNGIIAIRGLKCANAQIDEALQKQDICVREGLQCAPLAHKTLGTLKTGVIRISLSYFNRKEDAQALYLQLKE